MWNVESFVAGNWVAPDSSARPIAEAATGKVYAQAGNSTLDMGAALAFGRKKGGAALRAMSFHDRARMLKALALHLNANKAKLYEVSYATGATTRDHAFDIDGGIGTLFVYASKGRSELPDARVLPDGDVEVFGKGGTFKGQHIFTPLLGCAVHINAFNFPVWGMLEKLAPSLLAGMPSIVKPATATCPVTETCVRLMLEADVLPEGALQLVCGGIGNALDLVGPQDVVTFTGSAETALKLRTTPNLLENAVRFTAEQDSLNATILGPDATPDTPEFDLFVKEVVREMSVKAGQKCTAIRRIIVPAEQADAVAAALATKFDALTIGDPRRDDVKMGALVSSSQKFDVLAKIETLSKEAEIVTGGTETPVLLGDGLEDGAFVRPTLLHCADPDKAARIHDTEAFGPVSTILPYRDLDHAIALANRGQGSLVASLITHDRDVATQCVMGMAAWHGRFYLNNRDSMKEATGHGSPMPHMIHGGPGRAGGGEEMGGIRGVKHFMQRTAVQGSPDMLSAITGTWISGASTHTESEHPFRRRFNDLTPGETLTTEARTVTLDDIEHFAEFTGDTFYAHMDEEAAKRNPFFPGRVAHGYLLLSFAAGLFVEPNEGPVLANTGLDNLRFMKPVAAGDSIAVALTVKDKKLRGAEHGEVRWNVVLTNQNDEQVAEYELLTMVAV